MFSVMGRGSRVFGRHLREFVTVCRRPIPETHRISRKTGETGDFGMYNVDTGLSSWLGRLKPEGRCRPLAVIVFAVAKGSMLVR